MKGQKNAYRCVRCDEPTITVDTDEGTTPFMIGCKATPGCNGTAESSLYRLSPELQARPATHEWHKPTATDAKRLPASVREHVAKGGLVLREINGL